MNVLIHQKNSKKKKSNIENIYLIKDSLFVTLSSIIIIIIINIGVRVSLHVPRLISQILKLTTM